MTYSCWFSVSSCVSPCVFPRFPPRVLRLHRALARLHLIPQRVVDDPQVWDVDDGDPIFRVQPRVPLAGVRILAEMQPVPDQTADIKLVVQDAGAALAVAENGRGAPPAAARAGDALDVQGLGDLAGGGALLQNSALKRDVPLPHQP